MENTNVRTDYDKYRYLAALSYLNPVFTIMMLIIGKDSNYVRHHANQAVCLLLWFAACGIVCIIPILGWLAGLVGSIAGIVFAITAIVKTFKREYYEVPFLGKYRIIPEV